MSTTQSAIIWPRKYLPGYTDNYVSNEIIAKGVTAQQIWDLLADCSKWETYYENVSQVTPPATGPMLKKGDTFKFSTFGLPILTCPVHESTPPNTNGGQPGRLAWSAKLEGTEEKIVTENSALASSSATSLVCSRITEDSSCFPDILALARLSRLIIPIFGFCSCAVSGR